MHLVGELRVGALKDHESFVSCWCDTGFRPIGCDDIDDRILLLRSRAETQLAKEKKRLPGKILFEDYEHHRTVIIQSVVSFAFSRGKRQCEITRWPETVATNVCVVASCEVICFHRER